MRTKANWSGVDWVKQDTVIANELGVTRERVRQKRRQLRLPNAAMHKSHTWARWSGWEEMNWDLPGTVLSLVWGIPNKAMVEVHREHYGMPRPKYKCSVRLLFNEEFTRLVLAEQAKVSKHQAYTSRQRRMPA